MLDKIIEFNTYFRDCANNFLRGNCYWYAHILQKRFAPWAITEIMYNPIQNHFCCSISTDTDTIFADISGPIDSKNFVPWEDFIKEEPLEAARIYRDCIWHITPETWENLPLPYRTAPWYLEQYYNR